jgi:hypothetical protein
MPAASRADVVVFSAAGVKMMSSCTWQPARRHRHFDAVHGRRLAARRQPPRRCRRRLRQVSRKWPPSCTWQPPRRHHCLWRRLWPSPGRTPAAPAPTSAAASVSVVEVDAPPRGPRHLWRRPLWKWRAPGLYAGRPVPSTSDIFNRYRGAGDAPGFTTAGWTPVFRVQVDGVICTYTCVCCIERECER